MSAYIDRRRFVTKPAQYEDHKRLSTLAMRAYDAKVLVRGGESRHLEGREPGRTVIRGVSVHGQGAGPHASFGMAPAGNKREARPANEYVYRSGNVRTP